MNAPARLLAATDLSGPSLRAIERAVQLAAAHGARLAIVHALGASPMGALRQWLGVQADEAAQRLAQRHREALETLVADAVRDPRVQAELQVLDGHPAQAVREAARAFDADLLVVGAHGHGFVQRVLLGSTASALIRTSARPVLVVKQACRAPYRRVLLPIDFSPASERAVRVTRALAPGARLVLLHAFELPYEGMMQYAGVDAEVIRRARIDARLAAVGRLHDLAAAAGLGPLDYDADVLFGHPVRHVVSAERQYGCDLVVLGKHGTHVTEDLLLGSVTQHLLAETRSDVLVVTDPRRPQWPLQDGPQ
jgi:nucleotide-binding universal stress UspA family protein